MKKTHNYGLVEKSMGGLNEDQYMTEVMVNLSRDVEDLYKLYIYLNENDKNSKILESLETTIPEMKKTITEFENRLREKETTK